MARDVAGGKTSGRVQFDLSRLSVLEKEGLQAVLDHYGVVFASSSFDLGSAAILSTASPPVTRRRSTCTPTGFPFF